MSEQWRNVGKRSFTRASDGRLMTHYAIAVPHQNSPPQWEAVFTDYRLLADEIVEAMNQRGAVAELVAAARATLVQRRQVTSTGACQHCGNSETYHRPGCFIGMTEAALKLFENTEDDNGK